MQRFSLHQGILKHKGSRRKRCITLTDRTLTISRRSERTISSSPEFEEP